MNHLIRAAALSGYEELAASLGLDAPRLLRRFGLRRQALADPESLIPYRAMIELLEHSAAAAACPDLGLRLSKGQGLEKLGPLAVVIEHAASLREALALAKRYIFVHSPAVRLVAEPVPGHPEQLDLCYLIDMPELPAIAQATELALAVMLRCLRLLSQGRIPLLAVLLPHARQGRPAAYAQALGTTCLFEQRHAAVRLNARDLDPPLPKSNALLRTLAQAYLDQQFSRPEQAFSDRVRVLVRQRLADEGGSFELLKDQERRALFQQLIGRPNGPSVATLADLLGYAEPSALTRSARRWFGKSPTQLRRAP